MQDLYFSRGGVLVGQAGTTANLSNLSTLAVGTHSLTAKYVPASATYSASTSPVVTVSVNAIVPTITASAQPSYALTTQAVTLTASLSSTGPVPTGTISFSEGSTKLGSGTLQTQGNSSTGAITYMFATAGTHNVTASYSGDSVNAAVSTTSSVTSVTSYPTTTLLSASSSTVVAGATVTLVATVGESNPSITATPSGNVTFFDGTTSLGTSVLSGGKASLAVALSAITTHAITATYAGDASNTSSTSSALNVAVVTPFAIAPGTGSSTSLTASYNSSTSTSISLTPMNGFTGAVMFTCSSLPAGVNCAFNPPSVTVSGTGPVTTTLTVSTSSAVGALRPLLAGYGVTSALTGAFFLSFSFTQRRKRIRHLTGTVAAVLALLTLGLSGCGGGSSNSTSPTTPTTPVSNPKTVTFNVLASSSGAQVSTTYTLTVQ